MNESIRRRSKKAKSEQINVDELGRKSKRIGGYLLIKIVCGSSEATWMRRKRNPKSFLASIIIALNNSQCFKCLLLAVPEPPCALMLGELNRNWNSHGKRFQTRWVTLGVDLQSANHFIIIRSFHPIGYRGSNFQEEARSTHTHTRHMYVCGKFESFSTTENQIRWKSQIEKKETSVAGVCSYYMQCLRAVVDAPNTNQTVSNW